MRTTDTQFLTLDFRLLDNPAFCTFMRSSSFPLYLLLRRYVWRDATQRHPVEKVNELYAQGYLVCAVSRRRLAEKLGVREASHISRHLADLEEQGLLYRVRTGRQNVYVLGRWEARDMDRGMDRGRVIETFFLEQFHELGEKQVSRGDRSDVSRDDRSDVSRGDRSDVSRDDRSDVSPATPFNKEKNREENTWWERDARGHGGARARRGRPPARAAPPGGRRRRDRPDDFEPLTDQEFAYVPKYEPLYVQL